MSSQSIRNRLTQPRASQSVSPSRPLFDLSRWLPHLILSLCIWRTVPAERALLLAKELGPELLVFPFGPFSWLGGLTGERLVELAQYCNLAWSVGIILFVFPERRIRLAGGLIYLFAISTLLSIVYAVGKIDHRFIIFVLPVLIACDEFLETGTEFVRWAIFFFFAQSCLLKAVHGWFSPDVLAVKTWLIQYQAVHWKTRIGTFLLTHFADIIWFWKSLDVLTVLSEGAIGLLFLFSFSISRTLVVVAALIFHICILFLFGIPFNDLVLTYWWTLWSPRDRTSHPLSSILFLSWLVAPLSILFWRGKSLESFCWGLAAILFFGCLYRWCSGKTIPPSSRYRLKIYRPILTGAFIAYNLLSIGSAYFNREVFPSFGGPSFAVFRRDTHTRFGPCRVAYAFKTGVGFNQLRNAFRGLPYGELEKRTEQYLISTDPEYGKTFSCPFHGFSGPASSPSESRFAEYLDHAGAMAWIERL